MREIRFRAWDKKAQVMVGGSSDHKRRLWDEWYAPLEELAPVLIEELATDKNFVVEQYTGLKDKNGKDIYEGDIVRTRHGRLAWVEWLASSVYCGWDLKPSASRGKARFFAFPAPSFNIWWEIEVVGNIHENPELLKED